MHVRLIAPLRGDVIKRVEAPLLASVLVYRNPPWVAPWNPPWRNCAAIQTPVPTLEILPAVARTVSPFSSHVFSPNGVRLRRRGVQ